MVHSPPPDRNGHDARPQLAAVDGLRGVAIGLVVSYHVLASVLTPQTLSVSLLGLPFTLSPLLTNGWTGVNLFFVLSGFVLFLPYAQGSRSMATLANRLAFYRRRAWRLLPLFYVAAPAVWLLAPGGAHRDPLELLRVLTLSFPFDASSFGPSFLPPLWSLGVEIVFSAMFPVLVLLAARIGMTRLVLLALGVALAMRCVGIARLPLVQGPSFNSDMILCRIDDFVLGMALAQAWAAERLPKRTTLCAGLGLASVAVAWMGFDLVLRGVWPPLARAFLNDVLDAGIIAVAAAALAPAGGVHRALCWGPLRHAGRMSYSVYLWHLPLLWLLVPDRLLLPAPTFALKIALYLGATAAAAALSYRFIEFPGMAGWCRLAGIAPK
ncbi:MAG TPA: acyltransferase [Stellaceae bacterium]|nr:acyltransferase [Stellaceae bacterium]